MTTVENKNILERMNNYNNSNDRSAKWFNALMKAFVINMKEEKSPIERIVLFQDDYTILDPDLAEGCIVVLVENFNGDQVMYGFEETPLEFFNKFVHWCNNGAPVV